MRISTAAAVGSVASLLAGVGVPIAFPHAETWVGDYLLVAAGLLFALALGLWFPRKASEDGDTITQTNSTTVGGDMRAGDTYHVHGAQGGATFGRVEGNVSVGRPELRLTAELLSEIAEYVRTKGGGKPVKVIPVGQSRASFEIARSVTEHLRSQGVVVDDDTQILMQSPPLPAAVTIDQQQDGSLHIKIDASLGQ